MKTVCVNVYKFSELPTEEAKKKAIQNSRETLFQYGYHWADEAHETARKFCEEFGLKYKGSNFSPYNSEIDASFNHIDDDMLNLSGVRLMAYLWNNYGHLLIERKKTWFVRKADGTKHFNAVGHNSGTYTSKCYFTRPSCPLTGVCFDDSILQPVYDFAHGKNFSHATTFEDLLNDCLSAWAKYAESDCEAQEADEYIADHIEANEYEFTEDGDRY